MDFSFTADQAALRDLTQRILDDRCTNEHLRSIDRTDDRTDRELWTALARAGVVGIGLPEAVGGGGLGFIEVGVCLGEVARASAPVPAMAVMVLGGSAIARFGSPSQQQRWLTGVASGDRLLSAALMEPLGDPYEPATVADGDGRLTGTKIGVPVAHLASAIVVSALDGLYIIEPSGPGVSIERQETTSGQPESRLTMRSAPAERLCGHDGLVWLLERATAAQCVMMAALCDRAVKLTAEYAKTRVQFDRAIATFQAVSQRAADAFIDTEAIRLTAWQAMWRLAQDLPAATQVATAKFWAADGGQRALHAAQHIHGGVGVDRDYPLHRCFLAGKQLELALGSATPQLLRLGRLLAT